MLNKLNLLTMMLPKLSAKVCRLVKDVCHVGKKKNHAESPTKHASVAAYARCRFAVNILSLLIMRVMSVCDSQCASNGDE